MKKSSIIGGILVAIGVIAIVLSFALAGCNFKNYANKGNSFVYTDDDYVERNYTATSDIKKLVVDCSSDTCRIVSGNVDTIEIKYFENETQKYDIEEKGDTLTVKRLSNNGVKFRIGIDFSFKDVKMEITVPKSFNGEVDTDFSSGAISVKGLNTEKLTVKCTSGAINVEDIDCEGDVFIKASSGAVNVADVECADFTCEASSGAVNVDNVKCENYNSRCSSGLMRISDVKAEDIEFKSTSGEVFITRIDAAKSIKGNCTSGEIRGTIVGDEDDFSIIADTTSGSCNLKNSRTGNKTLDVETTSGDIHITFE
ncbi:MAG: DUF4097 family beta strand repeat protein [Lachnospiraceae bacterium]|nr:DUF4097 family beta strand repeat protein [Lachnospiraceae bacterium]